ncbi:RHS repeat-associated core domain-containing protein [Ekhidna sp. To15]|uniref:RHS repeat-associated core domain-containing protein n=1 Tax=Ekhidna sp. To15 TaxID=3395267 RepID=UPI003F524FE8
MYQSGYASYDSLTGYYDFLFRSYDPALGRFFAFDPMAASTPSYSPYHANFNNPISFTDPLGLSPRDSRFKDFGGFNSGDGLSNDDGWMTMEPLGFINALSGPDVTRVRPLSNIVKNLMGSDFGGSWSQGGGFTYFGSQLEAENAVDRYFNHHGWQSVKGGRSGFKGRFMLENNKQKFDMIMNDIEADVSSGQGDIVASLGPGDCPVCDAVKNLWDLAITPLMGYEPDDSRFGITTAGYVLVTDGFAGGEETRKVDVILGEMEVPYLSAIGYNNKGILGMLGSWSGGADLGMELGDFLDQYSVYKKNDSTWVLEVTDEEYKVFQRYSNGNDTLFLKSRNPLFRDRGFDKRTGTYIPID